MEFRFAAKSFGDKQVLQQISLSLPEGQVTALTGPSGIGKTTLLRMIAGLEADDSGFTQTSAKIGMVFQEPRLLPWLTVTENIELVGPENGWLTKLGLEEASNLHPRQLSLGMARRVAIARALAIKPQLLILDEPFASLDGETAAQVKNLLKAVFQKHPTTVLMVTHQIADVQDLAHHVMTLKGEAAGVMPAQLSWLDKSS